MRTLASGLTSLLLLLCLLSSPLFAEEGATSSGAATTGKGITNLDQLLQSVKDRQRKEAELNRKREAEFIAARDKQKSLLANAKKEFERSQKLNNPLKKETEANTVKIANLQKELKKNIEELGDIYTIFHDFSGDFNAALKASMVQSQFPEREKQLKELSDKDKLPAISDMEDFWYLVQQEMTESGKVARYDATVLNSSGQSHQQTVTRIGTFTAISEGKFLRYIPETGELLSISRQPQRYLSVADDFENSRGEIAPMIVDPSQGALLGMMTETPTLEERIMQGKEVGYFIILLGLIGLLVTSYRLLYLLLVWLKTRNQLRNVGSPTKGNPLGRVLQSAGKLTVVDEETLQYKLDEAILREIPRLERGHSFIKLLAATAPLLGLLGTVVGMIATFQAISLFGSGDPKLMAGGISQALVTTVLGLVVAIPLLFGHNIVSAFSRSLIQILDEQSAGILARYIEKTHRQSGSADSE
ncbi:MAG: MotA/TolQ/ExbB proton channel family protein [Pseudomonadales bacterium]|nr:MotA/TolQ/ExbB proton channel family protein [Pseudomonadales bacterium]